MSLLSKRTKIILGCGFAAMVIVGGIWYYKKQQTTIENFEDLPNSDSTNNNTTTTPSPPPSSSGTTIFDLTPTDPAEDEANDKDQARVDESQNDPSYPVQRGKEDGTAIDTSSNMQDNVEGDPQPGTKSLSIFKQKQNPKKSGNNGIKLMTDPGGVLNKMPSNPPASLRIPNPKVPYASPLDAPAGGPLNTSVKGMGFDSMFDTTIEPAWDTPAPLKNVPGSEKQLSDGDVLPIPDGGMSQLKFLRSKLQLKDSQVPSYLRVPKQKSPTLYFRLKDGRIVDRRGEYPFSALIQADAKNYYTAQNFYEFLYEYPVVPKEGSMPIGADYAYGPASMLQNPLWEPKIIGGLKDGGAPLPSGTYFSPI
jgi:hypothetical protein